MYCYWHGLLILLPQGPHNSTPSLLFWGEICDSHAEGSESDPWLDLCAFSAYRLIP
jgi:hypothetical protein